LDALASERRSDHQQRQRQNQSSLDIAPHFQTLQVIPVGNYPRVSYASRS
jgi:hypothetical protein